MKMDDMPRKNDYPKVKKTQVCDDTGEKHTRAGSEVPETRN